MTRLSVPDMTCGHCKASVEAALSHIPGAAPVTVNLGTKEVEVGGTAPADTLIRALDEIGFPARIVPVS
ncbi:heavy-metal-associated domain-containing protein [Fuscibacter oryzae]|uniref:Heavy-metal-associated domain-containing protein n=1 Tax=Fuscibacter oryzae TaxID=2803939 RepID=A0A8J7SS39_9RHOB|nr:heavy-metal-associated domain-containing protein [Fuscibacter oryzae]MBL4928056.1 heavy-metal-associated domain-containing protein [Fuscibacter oryzae]